MRLYDGELIATHARDRVRLANQAPQAIGRHAQQLVADRVAEGVVDMLEMVEVEDVRGDRLALLEAGQGLLQPFVQQHAVGQAGERVVQCQVTGAIGQMQHVIDVLAERGPVERLEQERGGARRQGTLQRAAAFVARQDENGNVLKRGVAAHAPDEVETIEVRHLEIDDGEIDDLGLKARQRLEAVLGLDDIGELGDFLRDDSSRERVVVHYQDRWPSHCSPERQSSSSTAGSSAIRRETVAGRSKGDRREMRRTASRIVAHS